MNNGSQYDVIIIGGGLAGLSLSILLKKMQYNVALFEKEVYPFHKVCGEYISMESWDFIQQLGVPLISMNLPLIKKLIVTAPDGTALHHPLDMGGFGISRYCLDNELKKIAQAAGVALYQNCKAEDIIFTDDNFFVQTSAGKFSSKICCGSFGKRSNIDIKWKRNFIIHKNNKLSNYIGVKYHIRTRFADDTIALHNFKDGYCGISKIEEDKYCLCYLTNAANLKDSENSIATMEKEILWQNPHLKNIFENSEMLYRSPVTISQISFSKKTQVENHVLLIGDAAGMIPPLCGNGMSMAMHAAKIASMHIQQYLQNDISRQQLETNYSMAWKKQFSKRLLAGRTLQHFFGKEWATNIFIKIMKLFPFITSRAVQLTHGKPF